MEILEGEAVVVALVDEVSSSEMKALLLKLSKWRLSSTHAKVKQ